MRRLWPACLAAICMLFFTSCRQHVLRRPVVYMRIGNIQELRVVPEKFFPNLGLYLRSDLAGFSVMSTHCTYDLSPLKMVTDQSGLRWTSSFSTSEYSGDGRVTRGPALGDLPYYRLEVKEGEYNGPPDTLYAIVGEEVDRNWRLPF